MKTKLITLMLACMASISLMAQGISFVTDKTYAQALAQAKQENKLLFIDCYTSWCGPCKMLSSKVFPQQKVGDYFNPRFVSMKVDMEKGEGVELKTKFGVRAFPTLLFINAEGEVIHRIVGACDADELIKRVSEGISEKGLASMQKRYAAGERGDAFLSDYLDVLGAAYMKDECATVASEYLKGKEAQVLKDEKLFKLFMDFINNVDDPVFKYIYANHSGADEKQAKRLEQKFFWAWSAYVRESCITREGNKFTFDEAKLKECAKRLKSEKVERKDEIISNTYIGGYQCTMQWNKYVKQVNKHMKRYEVDDITLYNYGLPLEQECQDTKLRAEAAKWFALRVAEIEKREAKEKDEVLPPGVVKAMPMYNFKKEFKKLEEKLSK